MADVESMAIPHFNFCRNERLRLFCQVQFDIYRNMLLRYKISQTTTLEPRQTKPTALSQARKWKNPQALGLRSRWLPETKGTIPLSYRKAAIPCPCQPPTPNHSPPTR